MFERNRFDSTNVQTTTIPAVVELDDGTVLTGKFIANAARSFVDVINSSAPFLEFEPFGEERSFVAKASIRSMKLLQVPVAPNLEGKTRDSGGFDPYAVLGVAKSGDWDDIRAAYVRLSKIYHPDRFNTVELPEEVRTYLEATVRRINIAYASLEKLHIAEKSRTSNRSQPVFTSQPRV